MDFSYCEVRNNYPHRADDFNPVQTLQGVVFAVSRQQLFRVGVPRGAHENIGFLFFAADVHVVDRAGELQDENTWKEKTFENFFRGGGGDQILQDVGVDFVGLDFPVFGVTLRFLKFCLCWKVQENF